MHFRMAQSRRSWAALFSTLFAINLGLASAGTAAAEDTYDLTGAVPDPKTILRAEVSVLLERGEFNATAGEAKQTGVVRMEGARLEEVEVQKVSPPDKYKYVLHIIDDYTTYDYVFGGEELFQSSGKVTFYDPLDQRKIRFTLTKDGEWRRTMLAAGYKEGQHGRWQLFGPDAENKNPNQVQQRKIQLRSIWELGNNFYPQDPVPVGHEWSADGSSLLRIMFGENWVEHSGDANLKFTEVVKYRGEQAANLEVSAKLNGQALDNNNNEIEYTIDVSGTIIIRSLDTNMDREINLTGDIEMKSVVTRDDRPVDVVITGPVTIKYLARKKQ